PRPPPPTPFPYTTLFRSGILHDLGLILPSDIFPGGQWWRVLGCAFVHIGLLHLIVNMVSLWMVGPLLEKLWGRWNYLAIYLVSRSEEHTSELQSQSNLVC